MKKTVIVLLHIGYWLIFLGLLSLIILTISLSEAHKDEFNFLVPLIFFSAIAVIPGMISFYFHYTLLFKKYFLNKKIVALVASSICVSLFSGVIGAFDMFLLGKIINGGSEAIYNDGIRNAIAIIIVISIGALLNGIIGLVMRGFITSYNDISLKEELSNKNHQVELELIRAQINPHFLFNTINNIDVLIQKDAEQASAYLNKLSDIMRFMLYETKTEKIYLAKELSYIDKYIELQKIRSSNPAYVNYEVKGEPGSLIIAPMLFIPFIENAFKHAENKKTEQAIKICIFIEKDTLRFECENKYNPASAKHPEQSGLGNDLIKKRLQLLYPTEHTLEITDHGTTYNVKLVLKHVH